MTISTLVPAQRTSVLRRPRRVSLSPAPLAAAGLVLGVLVGLLASGMAGWLVTLVAAAWAAEGTFRSAAGQPPVSRSGR